MFTKKLYFSILNLLNNFLFQDILMITRIKVENGDKLYRVSQIDIVSDRLIELIDDLE